MLKAGFYHDQVIFADLLLLLIRDILNSQISSAGGLSPTTLMSSPRVAYKHTAQEAHKNYIFQSIAYDTALFYHAAVASALLVYNQLPLIALPQCPAHPPFRI